MSLMSVFQFNYGAQLPILGMIAIIGEYIASYEFGVQKSSLPDRDASGLCLKPDLQHPITAGSKFHRKQCLSALSTQTNVNFSEIAPRARLGVVHPVDKPHINPVAQSRNGRKTTTWLGYIRTAGTDRNAPVA